MHTNEEVIAKTKLFPVHSRLHQTLICSHFADNIVERLHCLIDIKTPFLPAVVILFKLYCFRSEPRITHYCWWLPWFKPMSHKIVSYQQVPNRKNWKRIELPSKQGVFWHFFRGKDGRHSLKQLTFRFFLSLVFVPRWQYLEKVMFHCWKYRGTG